MHYHFCGYDTGMYFFPLCTPSVSLLHCADNIGCVMIILHTDYKQISGWNSISNSTVDILLFNYIYKESIKIFIVKHCCAWKGSNQNKLVTKACIGYDRIMEEVKMFNQRKKKMSCHQSLGSLASIKGVMQNITPAGNFSNCI